MAVDWNASDELSYIGSIIGGVGTIFLGIITISQTEQINRKNLENEKANTKRPFFIIEEISSDKKFDNNLWEQAQNGFLCFYNKSQYAYVKIKNVGDGVANNLMIEPWGFGHIPKEHRPNLCVPPESSCIIPIRLSEKDSQSVRFVQVIYENIIGYAYSQKIELNIDVKPEIIGMNEIDEGESFHEDQERYCANIFNIYPQIPIGMNKYNPKTGKYNYDVQ